MVIFEIKYFDKIKYATIYDTWDIPDKKHLVVSKAQNVTSNDVGKFLKLNDGSKQYVKILSFYKGRIDTSSGTYYKSELVSMANPRIPYTEYCGANKGDESFAVVPATFEEKMIVKQLANGQKPNKITKRVRVMTVDEMKNYFIERGKNETSVLEKLDELAFGKTNQHTMNALKAIDQIFNMNVLNDKKIDTKPKSLAELFGLGVAAPAMLESCERAEVVEQ